MEKIRVTTLDDRWNDMTEVERDAVLALHALLREMKEAPRTRKYEPVQFIEDIEYTLQHLWGFSRDRDFHVHWVDLKGCTCPKMDNRDLMGAPYRITNETCPHHNPENPF
jgi:hypothetical protein